MPDFSNQFTRKAEQILGPFNFDDFDPNKLDINPSQLINKSPLELTNSSIYHGQWNKITGIREGKGTLIWPDGGKYIGYWKNDKAHCKGRLVHPDGDAYEGEWIED